MTHPHFSRTQLRRAVLSSYLGSVIEYYDFLLYATASAVVFNKVFFSNLDPLVGTVASFGTLATGYFARPLGGIVFGHFGDRIGRKKMLVLSMTLMGVGSTLIGLLPTYAQIGVLGADPAGAAARRAGHRGRRRVGRRGADVRRARHRPGAACGPASPTPARPAAWCSRPWRWPRPRPLTGEEAFLAWGWRIPFLLSIVLLAVGLFVRARVAETPVFAEAAADEARRDRRCSRCCATTRATSLLSIGVGFGAFVAQGTLTTFVISYAVQAGFPRPTVLNALTLSSVVAVVRDHRVLRAVGPARAATRSCSPARSAMAVWAFAALPDDRQRVDRCCSPSRSSSARASCTPRGTGRSPRSTPSCSPPAPATPAPRSATRSPASARGIAPARLRLGPRRGRRHHQSRSSSPRSACSASAASSPCARPPPPTSPPTRRPAAAHCRLR